MGLEGKIAIVTGATRGIGQAIAIELAKAGVKLFLVGRNKVKLEQAELLCRSKGVEVTSFSIDLTQKVAPAEVIGKCREVFGGLDYLINNAGMASRLSVEDTTWDNWNDIMNLNARAPYFLSIEALLLLKKSNSPKIINISSVVGHKGYDHQSAYAASKHALNGWTKSLAREVQKDGIRVHLIAPGGVGTEMVQEMRPDINMAELITPQEIAQSVCFLLSLEGNGVIDELNIRRDSNTPWG